MAYEIKKNGQTINTIEADEAFCLDLIAAGEIVAYAEIIPAAPVQPADNPANWIITKGAFQSRMGMDGLAIAGSTHPVCVAVSQTLALQRCVDLKHPEAAQLLDLLIAAGQPVNSAFFPGSGPVTPAKKAAWLNTLPTQSERFTE